MYCTEKAIIDDNTVKLMIILPVYQCKPGCRLNFTFTNFRCNLIITATDRKMVNASDHLMAVFHIPLSLIININRCIRAEWLNIVIN